MEYVLPFPSFNHDEAYETACFFERERQGLARELNARMVQTS